MSDTNTNTNTDDDTTAIETYNDPETAPETTREERSGAMSGPREYDPIELYEFQRHRNGDETALLLCAFGNGYQAIAFDVDAGGQILESDEIGHAQDKETAVGMCEYWIQQNPDGVLGASEDDGEQTIMEKLGFGGDAL